MRRADEGGPLVESEAGADVPPPPPTAVGDGAVRTTPATCPECGQGSNNPHPPKRVLTLGKRPKRPTTCCKLPLTAAEELLEIIMRRYERASTMLTSNRPVEDWGKLLGDAAAVSAMLDRLLHHGHLLKCGPQSWRTKLDTSGQ